MQTLLYVVIGLVGVIVSAYRNKQKRDQAGPVPPVIRTPRNNQDPQPDLRPYSGPFPGTLADLFDLPQAPADVPVETVENGPSAEEGGLLVDNPESAAELAGMKMAEESGSVEGIPVEESFEEGQSDIQKLIAKYDSIRRELEQEYGGDDIASGEIVSVENEEAAQAVLPARERIFEPRKAIIYSEILKRKEY